MAEALEATNYELRITSYEFGGWGTRSHELRITNYELRITSLVAEALEATNYEPRIFDN